MSYQNKLFKWFVKWRDFFIGIFVVLIFCVWFYSHLKRERECRYKIWVEYTYASIAHCTYSYDDLGDKYKFTDFNGDEYFAYKSDVWVIENHRAKSPLIKSLFNDN